MPSSTTWIGHSLAGSPASCTSLHEAIRDGSVWHYFCTIGVTPIVLFWECADLSDGIGHRILEIKNEMGVDLDLGCLLFYCWSFLQLFPEWGGKWGNLVYLRMVAADCCGFGLWLTRNGWVLH